LRAAYAGRFTQTELARFVGVAQNTVSRWTTGEVEPSLADIAIIEEACELPKGSILRAAGLVDDPPTDERAIS
jgi:transcriptional regulator with XRE-family HTH domain